MRAISVRFVGPQQPLLLHRINRRPLVTRCQKGDRAKLERLFAETPSKVTPEAIRMAMFRRLNRVHDMSLVTEDDGSIVVVVSPDTRLPEKETRVYMRKLTDIAAVVNECKVAQVLIRALENLPKTETWPGGSVRVPLGRMVSNLGLQ